MIAIDSHIHTDYSSDCSTPMEAMVRKAVSLGLTGICFTDHMDYDFPEKYELPFIFDPVPYVNKIKELRRLHEPNLNIRTGVELGLRVHVEPQMKALLTKFDFDYVIGSIHIAGDMDPYHSEYWESFESEKKGILTFFETTLACLETLEDFDALGHLDYIIRYVPSKEKSYSYETYADIIDAILRQCIRKEKALEVNTSGYKLGNIPHPNDMVLKRYFDLGGELLTIGSDAHFTEFLAFHFNQCNALLKNIGFRTYVTYHGRKPIYHDLA